METRNWNNPTSNDYVMFFWLALILLIALFPPWQAHRQIGSSVGGPSYILLDRQDVGYAFLFIGPKNSLGCVDIEINFPLLFTQWVIVATLAGLHLNFLHNSTYFRQGPLK